LISVILFEAVHTKCKKCTQKQKDNLDLLLDWYTKNKPEQLNNLVAKSIEDLKKKNADE